MAANQQNLTHDEVWDDSALVDSWNDALDEYKKYHSIYRHGGNVDDLLKDDANATVASDAKPEINDSGLRQSPSAVGPTQAENDKNTRNGDEDDPTAPAAQPSASSASRPEGIPAPFLGSVQDEGLKKLMMSWYYAGYYTGLYEGQKQQAQHQ
ncbi:hypothetical protein PG995_015218 [Apiospora arundinis]|uniref:Survival motor neuron 1 n=1 Tax=Apiospora arundinis TaxID=335852 RepID=A0ABR2IGM3_9PEZI